MPVCAFGCLFLCDGTSNLSMLGAAVCHDFSGSCIDGRYVVPHCFSCPCLLSLTRIVLCLSACSLTSAWHWCSQIQKKPFYPIFLLAGFTSFDGEF